MSQRNVYQYDESHMYNLRGGKIAEDSIIGIIQN